MVKYSFVIPTYNNRVNVLNTIECALQQLDSPSFEIVLVDDGSDDGLQNHLEDYLYRDNFTFVRLERDHMSSRSRARNAGWKAARGEYIAFIDSDILVNSDYLCQLDRYFNANPQALVIGNRMHIKDTITRQQVKAGDLFSRFPFVKNNYGNNDYRFVVYSSESFNGRAIADTWLFAYSCNFAVSKKLLGQAGGFDENIIHWGIEDVELAYRLTLCGATVLINPYLDVLHQHKGHRDDLAIGDNRMEHYLSNIHYFLYKHPRAMDNYEDPVAQLVTGKYYAELTGLNCAIAFYPGDSISITKNFIEEAVATSNGRVVLYDYSDNSGFDLWAQVQPNAERILYFPMSRKVDVTEMMSFIHNTRESTHSEPATPIPEPKLERYSHGASLLQAV